MIKRIQAFFFKERDFKYYISICCIIKDENKYLEEWISYHLKIGVQHFFIYDNGSVIPLRETLEELNLFKYATVIDFPGHSMQMDAYQHCLKNHGASSKWMGFIDTDEFIVPKDPWAHLPVFLKNYEDHGGLGVNWLIFGSNNHVRKTDQPQLESFVYRSDKHFHANSHIKSIIQPRHVKKNRNPHYFKYKRGKFCVNENYVSISGAFSAHSTDKIQLNHYFCRSAEEYREKLKRGRADDVALTRSMELFKEYDEASNNVKDVTILDILNVENVECML